MRSPEEESTGPVIRDRRRIDPATGQVRDPGPAAAGQSGSPLRGPGLGRPGRHAASKPGGAPGTPGSRDDRADQGGQGGQADSAAPAGAPGGERAAAGETAAALATLAERTADLQRLQAEYANYRKRVERDRIAVREQALANVLGELLPILDDIGLAREHEQLTGGFKSVADSLESATGKLGLMSYGENGDPFDPNLHEALMHSYSADVTEPTCVRILQPGYKIGDRILRAARVAVAEPGDAEPGDAEPGDAADAGAGRAQDAEAEGGPGGGPSASDPD